MFFLMAKRSFSDHLTRIESYVALAQWLWDRWPIVLALLGGGVMTYLSIITQWILDAGPAVVGGIAITSALVILFMTRLAQYFASVKKYRDAQRVIAERVAAQNPTFNPAEKHFKSQRIDLAALADPMTNIIKGKKFDDCEIFGPATVFFGSGTIFGVTFQDVNVIAIRPDRPAVERNIITLDNCEIRGGVVAHINILGFPDTLANLVQDSGAFLLSFSGDTELDDLGPNHHLDRTPKSAAHGRQRLQGKA